MSLVMIAARFTDKPGKVDATDERRILTTLKMIYESGRSMAKRPISPHATSRAS